MNNYEYKIYPDVYNDIISGKKTIEYRLLNEKSNMIKTGDNIKFIVFNDEEKEINVEVINKYIYNNINDLWNHKEVLNNTLDYNKEEFIKAFYDIFGEEKVKSSKIVGIEFEIIEGE